MDFFPEYGPPSHLGRNEMSSFNTSLREWGEDRKKQTSSREEKEIDEKQSRRQSSSSQQRISGGEALTLLCTFSLLLPL